METLIVVPARYGSSRFPGKPLASIAGRSMVARVAARAKAAADALGDAHAVIATDDQRIIDHCTEQGIDTVMTPSSLPSGSDRALAAARTREETPRFVVNLQGDAPFTPIDYVVRVVKRLRVDEVDAATPVVRLGWAALDAIRVNKKTTPFSGTTAIVGANGRALWFSKQILPGIRDEDARRQKEELSPVRRHVGLYAFRYETLEWFVGAEQGIYERIEGLEQLRLLENGKAIACVEVAAPALSTGGIDTKEDLARVERLIDEYGDPDDDLFND
ncbi:MAG: 3-deoxy-manno-octulosonate cytidylyltransferase [Pseudomonadota bacterium]